MTTLLTMKGFNKKATPVTTPWIYHNPDLWLISLSSDWTNWITIADKNLWATQVYNSWDTLSEANCGNYYQWWNNYGFPFTWAVTTSSSQVDAQNYWPWNYYSSSTWITTNPRWSVWSFDLWWWVTNTDESKKWPCDEWYHIPSSWEMNTLNNLWITIWAWTNWWGNDVRIKLKLPFAWICNYNWATAQQWNYWRYWTATYNNSSTAYIWDIWSSWFYSSNSSYYMWHTIRPFANTPVQPDDSWTVLYPTN